MGLISAIFIICFAGGWSDLKSAFFNNQTIVNQSFDNYSNFDFSFFNYYSVFCFSIKIVCCCFIYIFVRASLPRKRFDQLIHLCWKVLFPITFSLAIFSISLYISVNIIYHYTFYSENIRSFSDNYYIFSVN
jgi:NADH:ubiquinone oxidoreductase subunit H